MIIKKVVTKMKHEKRLYHLISLTILAMLSLNVRGSCPVIGSDTAVNRFNTQVTISNACRVAGFAALAGGFAMTNSAATGTFDSFFGVSGNINMNAGTLILTRDLILQDVCQFNTLGNIIGLGHVLEIAPSVTILPTSTAGNPACFTFSNLDMFLNNDLFLTNCCITFTGNSLIDGQGNTLTLDSTATIVVGSNSSLAFTDIRILNVSDGQLHCTDSTSTITFKNTELVLDNFYSFTVGHFDIFSFLHIEGDGFTFAYQSNIASTIQPDASLILDHGVTFSYAPSIANRNLLTFVDSTAQLLMNGATLFSTTTGIQLTKGHVVVDSKSFFSSDAILAGQAISLGDGISAANNITLQFLPAATLELLKGRVVYNNV